MRAPLSVLCVLAALVPSAARAQAMDCGAEITYYPRGDRWITLPILTTTPVRPEPVVYRLYGNGSLDVPTTAEQTAIERAADTWNSQTCGNGTTRPSIELTRGADYAQADDDDIDNIVYWIEDLWTIADSATIALTTSKFVADTGYVVTSDMAFNGVNFTFRAKGTDNQWHGCSATGAGAATCYDVEAVGLHELGHFLGFNHVQCADAVMFPQATATGGLITLSMHENAGLCAVYPPRPAGAGNRAFGEQCQSDAECGTGLICVISQGGNVGWCSKSCTSDAGCNDGYVCAQVAGGTRQFCRPGPHNSGSNVPVNVATGEPADLCSPCTSGDQCANGLCVNDGRDGSTSLCTQACSASFDALCPIGMSCIAAGDTSVCWPASGTCVGNDVRGALNQTCYVEATGSFSPCGPELTCAFFMPRAEGQVGACVGYCNASDSPCPDANQTCCFGVDARGNCIEHDPAVIHGGCFDLRREGESCVTAEESVCEAGLGCFNFSEFGDASTSRCFRYCDASGCGGGQVCLAFGLSGGGEADLCCKDGTGLQGQPPCEPTDKVQSLDVGVSCSQNADCDSGDCLTYGGERACTRSCNPVTGYGCPGDIDVNGDGLTDGGFTCRLINGEGLCWPKLGPAVPPAGWIAPDLGGAPDGGCCNAQGKPASHGEVAFGSVLWVVMLGGYALRSRLKRRAAPRA